MKDIELKLALEEMSLTIEKLLRLNNIKTMIAEKGVNRHIACSMEEIHPTIFPEYMSLDTFTIDPTQVNLDYCVEGIEETNSLLIKSLIDKLNKVKPYLEIEGHPL
jgi:hypothetical protein